MKLETFFEKFDQFADAPDAVAKMRELVLRLAVRGSSSLRTSDDRASVAVLEAIWREGNSSNEGHCNVAEKWQPSWPLDDEPSTIPPTWDCELGRRRLPASTVHPQPTVTIDSRQGSCRVGDIQTSDHGVAMVYPTRTVGTRASTMISAEPVIVLIGKVNTRNRTIAMFESCRSCSTSLVAMLHRFTGSTIVTCITALRICAAR